ncbi:hypothetical protein TEA_016511 [Camellia sinensis var. sinensis]|uniref:Uncharacterized protein n=1 Tax=Camellia sinensis var. sinensis TaxID=542762 RepID=A0A4S4DSX7_CAMSN|nr:hypothetical protein TEA_016511 [Camellia sinensis var. sinensis]
MASSSTRIVMVSLMIIFAVVSSPLMLELEAARIPHRELEGPICPACNSFRDLSVLIVYAALLFRSRHAAVNSFRDLSVLIVYAALLFRSRHAAVVTEDEKKKNGKEVGKERRHGKEDMGEEGGGREEGREGEGKVEHTSDREWPYLV